MAEVTILSLAFHKQFPPLEKGQISLLFSRGLQGYKRSLKGVELRLAFNILTPRYTHTVVTITHTFQAKTLYTNNSSLRRDHFKLIFSFVFHRSKSYTQLSNDMWINTFLQNFHYWVNHLFKRNFLI